MERPGPACASKSRMLLLCMLPTILVLCLLAFALPAFASAQITTDNVFNGGYYPSPSPGWGGSTSQAFTSLDYNHSLIYVLAEGLTANNSYTASIYDSTGKYLESCSYYPLNTECCLGNFCLYTDGNLQSPKATVTYGTPWHANLYLTSNLNTSLASCNFYVDNNYPPGGGGGGSGGTVVTGISASPNPVNILNGGSQQLTVWENYNTGSPTNITSSSTYSSADTSKVTVSSAGLISSVNPTSTPVNVTVTWDGGGYTATDPVTVYSPISITTSSLPAGTVGVTYAGATLAATGGSGSYTWSATGLPGGLSINSSTGAISGTPTATFSGSVTVTATDAVSYAGNSGSTSLSLTVNAATITGSASLNFYSGDLTGKIQIYLDGTQQAVTDANGNYTISGVSDGNHLFEIEAPGYLRAYKNIDITGSIVMPSVTLIAGDVNGDDVVNIEDYTAVIAAYGSTPGSSNWNAAADFNRDGVVNIADVTILQVDYGKSATQIP